MGKSQDLVKGQNWWALTGTGKNRVETFGTQTHRLRTSNSSSFGSLQETLVSGRQREEKECSPGALGAKQGTWPCIFPSLLVHSPPWDSHMPYCQCFSKGLLVVSLFLLFLTIMPLPLGKRRKFFLLAWTKPLDFVCLPQFTNYNKWL